MHLNLVPVYARVYFQVHACVGRVFCMCLGADEYLIVCLARASLPLCLNSSAD